MIVVELMGGLGNQLFQYAIGRRIALQTNTNLFVDTGFLMSRNVTGRNVVYRNYDLDIFTINPPLVSSAISQKYGISPSLPLRFARRFFNRWVQTGPLKYVDERTPFQYDHRVDQITDNAYLSGYWQSIHYFRPIEDQLRAELQFVNPIPAFAQELAMDLGRQQSVCVHVRRSDFVKNMRHNVIQPDYYQQAERVIRGRVNDPVFYVFSDDIEWCRANLRFTGPTVYVGDEWAGERAQTYLQLMTRCRHYIIPNSTFGWWAAWLNTGLTKVVVAPTKWIYNGSAFIHSDELVYPDWIRI